jgi:NACalpha-BTF3-like transcription factor
MTTTDTPRTDAVVSEPCAIHQVMQKWEKIIENSRQLERELNELWSRFDKQMEAEAEVERLKAISQDPANAIKVIANSCDCSYIKILDALEEENVLDLKLSDEWEKALEAFQDL